jgi:hypothetical protein
MIETGRTPIYYNWHEKLKAVAAAVIVWSLPIGLVVWGWQYHEGKALLICGAIAAALFAATWPLLYTWLRSINRPAVVIRGEGIEIEPEFILPWTCIEVVGFKYDGQKGIGIRLREDFERVDAAEIRRRLRNKPSWFMFKMPWSFDYDGLSVPGQDLIQMLRSHGLAVTEHVPDIARGHEDELR